MIALGVLGLALLPGGRGQDPGLSGLIKQRISEWETDPALKRFTVLPAVQPPPGTAQALGLVIGLNEVDQNAYGGGVPILSGCLKDVETMSAILRGQNFSITALRNNEATRDRVISEIRKAARQLQTGDILVITYSGHGSEVPDLNGDEPKEHPYDQTICLYDGMMIDDELADLWTEFRPGVRIAVFADSCHSGTVTKALREAVMFDDPRAVHVLKKRANAEDFKKLIANLDRGPAGDPRLPSPFRALPVDVSRRAYTRQLPRLGPRWRTVARPQVSARNTGATVLLISGCQDSQVSGDLPDGGLFTLTLNSVWDNGNFVGDYPGFQRAIVRLMPASQQPNYFVIGAPNKRFEAQKPFTK
jgi:hypothetical protein